METGLVYFYISILQLRCQSRNAESYGLLILVPNTILEPFAAALRSLIDL